MDLYDDSKKRWTVKRVQSLAKRYRNLLILGLVALYTIYSLLGSGRGRYTKEVQQRAEEEATDNLKNVGFRLDRKNSIDLEKSTLRERMAFYFPYEPEKPMSRDVWQTWKCNVEDKSCGGVYAKPHETWKKINHNSDVYLITDDHADDFIATAFEEVPEIVETYRTLPKNILKADLFRYLVVYAKGGTYSDVDTVCLKPLDSWAPFDAAYLRDAYERNENTYEFSPRDMITPVGLTIGIEADPNREDWAEWYARRIQFCQWTIQGKRGHPLLRELILRIVEETARKKQMGKLKKVEGKDQGGDIMQWTGPGIFTDVVFDYLNNVMSNGKSGDGFGVGSKYWLDHKLYKSKSVELTENGEPAHSSEESINWKLFTGLKKPVMVDDVMILPITSFSPAVGQMGAGPLSSPLAYVQHLFGGSWKDKEEKKGKKKELKEEPAPAAVAA